MKTSANMLLAAGVAACCIATTASAEQTTPAFEPKDFLVFVDHHTGFVFVKTPVGWRFIRKIESEEKLALAESMNPYKPTIASEALQPLPQKVAASAY